MNRYGVKEIFLTLQGEGGRTGQKSVFVRATACNLWNGRPEDRDKGKGACARWCDTDFVKGSLMTAAEILDEAQRLWPGKEGEQRWFVFTGGEPLLQVDDALIDLAHAWKWKVAVETNGTLPAPSGVDWLTVSPKRGGGPIVPRYAAELKVVLPGGLNGEGWSDDELLDMQHRGTWDRLYVQPQDVVLASAVEQTYLKRSLLGFRRSGRRPLPTSAEPAAVPPGSATAPARRRETCSSRRRTGVQTQPAALHLVRTAAPRVGAFDSVSQVVGDRVKDFDRDRARAAVLELLSAFGFDPSEPGILATPDRVSRAWAEMLSGYQVDTAKLLTTDFDSDHYDEMILLKGVRFVSTCEHHLMPFEGQAAIAYVPNGNGRVVGLSKLARLVDAHAKRLQIQERMTRDIACELQKATGGAGVAVVLQASHSCMCARGVQKPGSQMITSTMMGCFRDKPEARVEVLALLR